MMLVIDKIALVNDIHILCCHLSLTGTNIIRDGTLSDDSSDESNIVPVESIRDIKLYQRDQKVTMSELWKRERTRESVIWQECGAVARYQK